MAAAIPAIARVIVTLLNSSAYFKFAYFAM
jgi:hypothetical protein